MKKLFIFFLLLCGLYSSSQTPNTITNHPTYNGNLLGTWWIVDISPTQTRKVGFNTIESQILSDTLMFPYSGGALGFNGFVGFPQVTSSPAAQANVIEEFQDSSGRRTLRYPNGFMRSFKSNITANRQLYWPDVSDTIADRSWARSIVAGLGGGGFSNPMTTLGDIIYGGASGTPTRLAGNITSVKQFLSQTGNGSISAIPAWATISTSDITGVLNATSFPAMTGDVTNTSGTLATLISNNVVTNAKLSQMSAHTFKGNNTGSTANALDLTANQLTAELNVFTTSLQGVVPASGGGTTNFLRADGTWTTTPSGFANPMTTLGDIIFENATPTPARLAGNTAATKQFLSQTGNGSISASPVWGLLIASDIPNITESQVTNLTTDLAAKAPLTTTVTAISAAGTTQGGATALTGSNSFQEVTTVAANSGVSLPVATSTSVVTIANRGANPLFVYPATSGVINAQSTNTAIVIPVNSVMQFFGKSATTWYTDNQDDPYITALQAVGSPIKATALSAHDLGLASNAITIVSQQIRYIAIYLYKGQTLTGIKVNVRTGGSYTASNFNGVALYTSDGTTLTQVAISANTGAIWNGASNTTLAVPFTGTYVAASGLYYAALMWSSSATTTAPAFSGYASSGQNTQIIIDVPTIALQFFTSTQTAMPATQAISGGSVPPSSVWAALY